MTAKTVRSPLSEAFVASSFLAVVALLLSGRSCHAWTNVRTPAVSTPVAPVFPVHGTRHRNVPFRSVPEIRMAKRDDEMLEFIERTPGSSVGDAPTVPIEQDEIADLARCIVKAADSRKAEDIVALRVSAITTVTSFVVIVCGNSRPQNSAIAAAIQDDMDEQYGLLPGSTGVPEGTADSGWMVLDYGSVIAHVMTPKSRLFYDVEGKYRDEGGEYMDLSSVILPNTPQDVSNSASSEPAEEDDPFWS